MHSRRTALGPAVLHPLASLALTIAFLIGLASSGRTADTAAPSSTNTFRHTESVITRDGVALATDIHLPSASGKFPVVLLRTPYNKESGSRFADDGNRHGYAIVIQDTRGRFASAGENLPFHLDANDGEDTVQWITRQPWCNGHVGTSGGSAGAITQFQLALTGVHPLEAQFLVVGAPSVYEVVYTGGVFRKSLVEDWIRVVKFATNALPIWESHPTYDDYWRARDASRKYREVEAPSVHVGGWWDIFAQPTLDAFVGYQTASGRGARGKQKLIMGPWSHGVLAEKAGELTFPNAKNPPGDTEDTWRWYDRWLKALPNGADRDPAVRYYVVGDVSDPGAPGNTWRTADQWPPFPVRPTPFYLLATRGLSAHRGAKPSREPLAYTYQPTNPVPTIGGIQLTLPAGPMDQRKIESRDDVLVFSTEPLTDPLEVTGRVRARLWISSDAPDTDFFVRLCDVYPDGRSFNLCEGMLRARFRRGFEREQLLRPGEIVPLDIDAWSTSVIFNRGHRIRVQVTSSCAPGFDPNPNTGAPFRKGTETRAARNAIHLDAKHPSHILLPVINRNAPGDLP